MYRLQRVMLFGAILCYIIDALLYTVDSHLFCTLQCIKPVSSCATKNEYFHVRVAFFCLVWAPIWYACN